MDWQKAFIARAKAVYPRTYWVNASQDTPLPYATLIDVTQMRAQTLTGWDLEFARVQIDVWGLRYAEVQAGMESLLEELVPAATLNGHVFQRADIALGPRDVSGEREGSTTIYRKSADLIVPHKPE